MDALKYQVFPCQNFPRHVLFYTATLYIQYKNNFSHGRVHDNYDDEAASKFQLEQQL